MQIVLIPGLMNDAWVWRNQIGPLSRLGSVFIACNDGCSSLSGMAERIVAATSGPVRVIGHSMGGRVALEVAALAPERVERLVLMATGAAGPTETEAAGRNALVDLARRDGMGAVARAWLPPMLGTVAKTNDGLVAGISAMVERCPVEAFAGQQRALLERHDRTALLAELGCPVLFVAGEEDGWSDPASHRAMAARVRGARVEVIRGSGHMIPVEQPELVAELLAGFLGDEVGQGENPAP